MTIHPNPPGAAVPFEVGDDICTGSVWVGVDSGPLSVDAAMQWAVLPQCGAIVAFSGVVREASDGCVGVESIDYEVYAAAVTPRLFEISRCALERWPMLGRIVLRHRCGRVELGESSVVVVVSSPHRGDAFEAAEFCIDVLKRTVPVWKLEHSSTESQWVETGVLIETVAESARHWDLDHASSTRTRNRGIS
ncbi:molybdenum cofactor biosynthesis protein MoaE [Rhodococcus koreensis]|uniref:molybdenum cofactor biosynthesis protein MoaE n=1 Tax=Rhodococcus koreensis TaxID=99653 RepID=UPI00366CAD27